MPKLRALNAAQLAKSLVVRLGPVADSVRQIATELGARSYRCFLVWTQWTGEFIGDGDEIEVDRLELLPTPKVEGLDAVALQAFNAGILPVGTVRLTGVSSQLTEAQLRGLFSVKANVFKVPQPGTPDALLVPPFTKVPADHLPPLTGFHYELVMDSRLEALPLRWRYRLGANPWLDDENVQWVLVLERISEDSARDGASTYGQGA